MSCTPHFSNMLVGERLAAACDQVLMWVVVWPDPAS
jgi:hypothetical protein